LLSQVDQEGGTSIGYQQFQELQKRNTEIEKILDSVGVKSAPEVKPEGIVVPFKKKPEEFAIGGSVGLDYLTGQDSTVERENYAFGSFFKKFINSIKREAPPTSSIPSTSDVPLTILDRYKNYLSQFEKPSTSSLGSGIGGIFGRLFNSIRGSSSPQATSNDDLYNLYRSGVEGKAEGGRIGYAEGGNVKSKKNNFNVKRGLDYLVGE
jgi:hypothetical protein